MKNSFPLVLKRTFTALSLLFLISAVGLSANTKTNVINVSSLVNIENDVDYTITGATPFGDNGVVNIVNTDHAVVILKQVKPSAGIKLLANHVQINGVVARNGSNCQVKIYDRGCIILPYPSNIKPLTVYSEQNFEGESCNTFGLENTGGFMNTLSDEKLNNRIRSFKLKRGYMVTFSLRTGGRGYSRCFIAADKDLEMATLPAVMDRKISSYRIFKWYDTGKQQLAAAGGDNAACSALNVTSTYTWGTTGDMSPDVENVPHHIYENYPSPSALGACTTSPHMKTNNEPMNPADDPKEKTESVDQVLANWEELMRTGMRLCSPSSWDGSDYTNGTGYIKRFIDSIDARGWRCDIIDLHCYWPEGNFGTIKNWTNSTGRPVWISEWVWGASWNSNGAFANGVTEAQNAAALKRICPVLNSNDCIERYYYWNGERDPSKVYKNGALTEAGTYYATIQSGLGYNGKYDFVPKTPKQYGPSDFSKTISEGKIVIKWYDPNGEFNQLMEIQKKDETGIWVTSDVIEQKELPASYTYTIDSSNKEDSYRLHFIDLNGKEYFSTEEISTGDIYEVDGKTFYVGGNMFPNGDFDMGFTGWYNGTGTALSEPYFQIVANGGAEGGAYLQAHGNGPSNNIASLLNLVNVEPGKNYLFRTAVKNGNVNMRLSLTANGTTESKVLLSLKSTTEWTRLSTTFNSEEYENALLSYRNLSAKAQMDKIELRQLFETREEAVADGVKKAKVAAELIKTYNTTYPQLNNNLSAVIENITGDDDAALALTMKTVESHLKAVRYMAVADSLKLVLQSIADSKCANYEQMISRLQNVYDAINADEVIEGVDEVKGMLKQYLDFVDADNQPQNSSFESVIGWDTKVGTYTEGDQKMNTVNGKSCWNAWWGISKASNPDATMEIRQSVSGLAEGFYTLECKATTEHFCLSDQHAYLKYGDKTVVSPNLEFDYFDLPVSNIWQTLTTSPIYVAEGGNVTIGFVGSKNGAVDGKWHAFGKTTAGDNREGWWCATDFVLKYHPVFKKTVIPGEWGIICLPYAVDASEEIKFYQIVGINTAYNKLCLEELEQLPAGVPCVYRSTIANAVFYEYGDRENTISNGSGVLRGFYYSAARVPAKYFYMKEGKMVKQTETTSANRPYIGSYTGIMYPFTDSKNQGLPVYDVWDGETMDIVGVTQDDIDANTLTTSIDNLSTASFVVDGFYTIAGRRVAISKSHLRSGLYIKVENGKAKKVIIR